MSAGNGRFAFYKRFSGNGCMCLNICGLATNFPMKMREEERNGNWFAVESKSFELKVEGLGKKAKYSITERSRGIVSWIRFGVEGMNKLLLGVEECCRDFDLARRPFEWREKGRFFRLECKENIAGRFLLCSVIDDEGKKHRLVFPEGKGFLNGWTKKSGEWVSKLFGRTDP